MHARTLAMVVLFLMLSTSHATAQIGDEEQVVGFKADHVYDSFAESDSVDVLTGAVNISRPIASYAVNGNLAWDVRLRYSGIQWRRNDNDTTDIGDDFYDLGHPSWVSPGWSLHFGYVFEHEDGDVSYTSRDGGTHGLDEIAFNIQKRITRDATYVRAWKYPLPPGAGGGWKVYQPDGTVVELRHWVEDVPAEGGRFHATRIVDVWGNRIDISYHPAPHAEAMREIADAHGRRVVFELWPDDTSVPIQKRGKLRRILYPTFGDAPGSPSGVVDLDYEIQTVSPPGVTGTPSSDELWTDALLSVVTQPLGTVTTYSHDGSGHLDRQTLPTGAAIRYEYGKGLFLVAATVPRNEPGGDPELVPVCQGGGSWGVIERTVDVDGSEATTADSATWTYHRWTALAFPLGEYPTEPIRRFIWVSDPDGNDTVHEFAGCDSSAPSHLPVARHQYAGPCGASQAGVSSNWEFSGHRVQSTEFKWEVDDTPEAEKWNPRIIFEKTTNHEDGSWSAQSRCTWNGLGQFRTTTLRETSYKETTPISAVQRSTVTDWAPILRQWILGTRSREEVSEDNAAAVRRFRHGVRGELLEELRLDEFVTPDPVSFTCNCESRPFHSKALPTSVTDPFLAANQPSTQDLMADPYPTPPAGSLPTVFSDPLVAGPGDVLTVQAHFGPMAASGDDWHDEDGFVSSGNVKEVETSGADTVASGSTSQAVFTQHLRWAYGSRRSASWEGMAWKSNDSTIDAATGRVAMATSPGGFKTSYQFDALGRIRTITPHASVTDGPVSTEAPTRLEYTFNPPTASLDKGFESAPAHEHSTEYYLYDGLGRIVRRDRRDSDGSIVSSVTTWTPGGRKLSDSAWVDTDQNEPRGPLPGIVPLTTYEYTWTPSGGGGPLPDPFGRIRLITHADGSRVEIDHLGLREVRRIPGINGDPNQVSETKLYRDTLGRLGFVDAPAGSTDASYQYDLHDAMKRASLDGQLRLWTRDALGRLVSEQQPESGLTLFPAGAAYDAMGRVLRRVDADGRMFDSTFDPAGRLRTVSATEPGQAQRLLTRITYDQADHGTYAASNATTTEQWNCLDGGCELVTRENFWTGLSGRLGRMRLSQSACGLVLEGGLGYDELGLERVRTQPEIVATQCAYAKLMHLPEIWTGYSHGLPAGLGRTEGGSHFVKLMSYAPSGAPNFVRLGNDVFEATEHDALMRTSSIRVTKDATVLWESGQYAYDGASNVVSLGPTGERPLPQVFGYDLAGRLTSAVLPEVGTFAHFYDPWGNMTTSLLAHGGEPECVPGGFFGWGQFSGREYLRGQNGTLDAIPTNRTSSLGSTCPRYAGAQITYDNAGRVTQDDTSLYTWDAQDRLLRRQRLDLGTTERFTYDASGYRAVTETVGGDRRVEFRGPDGEVWRTFDAPEGGPLRYKRDYIRLGSKTVAIVEDISTTVWQHSDHLGSARATSLADGSRRDRFDYSPFGLDLNLGMSPGPHERCFASHERSGDGTVDYMTARWASASGARFLSTDPAMDVVPSAPASWNSFPYTRNNPLTLTDPDGRAVQWAVAGAGAILGGVLTAGVKAVSNHVRGRPISEGVGKAFVIGAVATGVAIAAGPQASSAAVAALSRAGIGLSLTTAEVVATGAISGGLSAGGSELVENGPSMAVLEKTAEGAALGGVLGAAGGALGAHARDALPAAVAGESQLPRVISAAVAAEGEALTEVGKAGMEVLHELVTPPLPPDPAEE